MSQDIEAMKAGNWKLPDCSGYIVLFLSFSPLLLPLSFLHISMWGTIVVFVGGGHLDGQAMD